MDPLEELFEGFDYKEYWKTHKNKEFDIGPAVGNEFDWDK